MVLYTTDLANILFIILFSCHCLFLAFSGGFSESSMAGGYTQSPGGFASPALSQGGEKKGVCISVYTTTAL